MPDQVLQAELDVDAPPAKVWALVSDLSLMPRWSPQCRLMKTFGPLRAGAKTFNLNRRNLMFWPTTCQLTEVVPELEPTTTGTRVVETRRADGGVAPAANFVLDKLFGGVPSFERELVEGMNTSLRRIKAAAEGRQGP